MFFEIELIVIPVEAVLLVVCVVKASCVSVIESYIYGTVVSVGCDVVQASGFFLAAAEVVAVGGGRFCDHPVCCIIEH